MGERSWRRDLALCTLECLLINLDGFQQRGGARSGSSQAPERVSLGRTVTSAQSSVKTVTLSDLDHVSVARCKIILILLRALLGKRLKEAFPPPPLTLVRGTGKIPSVITQYCTLVNTLSNTILQPLFFPLITLHNSWIAHPSCKTPVDTVFN